MYACELGESFAGGSPCLAEIHLQVGWIFHCHVSLPECNLQKKGGGAVGGFDPNKMGGKKKISRIRWGRF